VPSTIRTVAAHEVVRATYPREVTERDAVGIAAGKAIDSALADMSYRFSAGLRPSMSATDRLAQSVFEDELAAQMVLLTSEQRQEQLRQIAGVVRAFRASPLLGLPRPKSRLIVIDEAVGVYAQPDYWDGRSHIFEMKSYHADPIPLDVVLQLELFQLAFPGFDATLAEFDRHATPVRSTLRPVPGLDPNEGLRVLRLAREVGSTIGQPRVLDYVDNPTVRYQL
jgi:hypothetical protein